MAAIRQCASCNLCCIHLEIESRPGYSTRLDTGEDLAKPRGTPCSYLGASGCTIYEVRPVVCRRFQCDWMLEAQGYGQQDSPEKIGIMGVRGDAWQIPSPEPKAS